MITRKVTVVNNDYRPVAVVTIEAEDTRSLVVQTQRVYDLHPGRKFFTKTKDTNALAEVTPEDIFKSAA